MHPLMTNDVSIHNNSIYFMIALCVSFFFLDEKLKDMSAQIKNARNDNAEAKP